MIGNLFMFARQPCLELLSSCPCQLCSASPPVWQVRSRQSEANTLQSCCRVSVVFWQPRLGKLQLISTTLLRQPIYAIVNS